MESNRLCGSARAALCFIIIASLVQVGFAGVLCSNPRAIGELRVYNSRKCVDIHGNDGEGNVLATSCDGGDDQQMIMCGDGTIRNERKNYCLQPTGNGNANVVSAPCSLGGRIPARQRWRSQGIRRFVDRGGIRQVATRIINEESNRCLDVKGSGGTGNILSWDCSTPGDDQFFYIRSRGKEIMHGKLQNERSGLCVDVDGLDGRGNVKMGNCVDKPHQLFRFYQNGEIVNEQSRKCVEVDGNSGNGNILMHDCEDYPDQMWYIRPGYCHGDYCAFINKKSRKCLDVKGDQGRGNIETRICDGHSDQRFKWVTDKWETPTATWNQIGCNQNGGLSHDISNTVTFGSEITSTTSIEVSSTIQAGIKFIGSAEITTTVTTSLSEAWSTSQSGTTAISFTCENYDNGDPFTGGCMWQLQVQMTQLSSGQLLTWTPQIVKCTSSDIAPKCPPFTQCKDEGCTKCISSV